MERKRRSQHLDIRAGTCGYLNAAKRQIDSFEYWRDRITILKQAFDDAEPRSISQLWHDDRKKVQWYTFWVAVVILAMTCIFGTIQTLCGLIQAWASIKSLSRKQV